MMPNLDGFEVCRRIRAEDTSVPVLFLSAKSEEPDVVAGLKLGADDFVRKPFGRSELLARIRSALRRAKVQEDRENASFQIGEWIIEPSRLSARKEGAEVDLTPREVSLLRVFHERQGEVVSRDELLDACWGIDYYPESRTLDQHIAMLRKKIESDPARPCLIETVRGVGYRGRP
jgi:DNA-binding response OmpR family regulator